MRRQGSTKKAGGKIASTTAANGQLGPIGSRTGYLLHRTNLMHLRVIRELLAEHDLTPARATALTFVRQNPGCGQAELGRALEINRASTMEVVNALENVGALERRNGRDKRSNSLFLTPAGERMDEQFNSVSLEVDRIITSSLSDQERDELDRLLGLVRSSVETYFDT